VKSIREQVAEQFRHTVVGGLAATTPIPRETNRAVVQQVLERAWTAECELKEARRDLPRLKWQAGRYEDLCVRLDLPRGDDCVSDVVAAVGRDKHQAKLQGRLAELDLRYQATLADLAAERLKVAKLEKERAEACENAGYWMQRAEGNKHNYDKGRASALVEVMQLLEGDLEDHDLYVYDVYRSIIEQVREIKP
jgi:hypothetical protein